MIELYHTYWGTLSSWFSCICTINIEEPWVCDWVESVRYMLRNLEFVIQLYLYDTYWVISRVVNLFWKWSLNNRFFVSFFNRFQKRSFSFGRKRSFLKRTHSFWTFRKRITIISSYLKLNSCGGAKTSWYFLKNFSMINTDALKVGFLY